MVWWGGKIQRGALRAELRIMNYELRIVVRRSREDWVTDVRTYGLSRTDTDLHRAP